MIDKIGSFLGQYGESLKTQLNELASLEYLRKNRLISNNDFKKQRKLVLQELKFLLVLGKKLKLSQNKSVFQAGHRKKQ